MGTMLQSRKPRNMQGLTDRRLPVFISGKFISQDFQTMTISPIYLLMQLREMLKTNSVNLQKIIWMM